MHRVLVSEQLYDLCIVEEYMTEIFHEPILNFFFIVLFLGVV